MISILLLLLGLIVLGMIVQIAARAFRVDDSLVKIVYLILFLIFVINAIALATGGGSPYRLGLL